MRACQGPNQNNDDVAKMDAEICVSGDAQKFRRVSQKMWDVLKSVRLNFVLWDVSEKVPVRRRKRIRVSDVLFFQIPRNRIFDRLSFSKFAVLCWKPLW